MFTKYFLSAVTLVSTATAAAAVTTFDADANTNMAVYWGQGPGQQRLAHFCEDSTIDIIPVAFLNIFPDQVNGSYPGTNFGNQCGPETFVNKDGSDSPLLSNCQFIGPDIKTCQAMGKKVLLSLGGAIPTNQSINDDESAVAFANFLWNAFGPEDATYDGPRPFGDAVVDGFDFDIESEITGNDPASQYRGYGTMIDTLRVFFAADAGKEYYISAAPQCVIPDAHLSQPIETAWFDFLFVQFYNTPQCSARAYFDASYGRVGDKPSSISFDAWVNFVRSKALNKDVKLYIGLPAAPAVTYDPEMYIAPEDVYNLIDLFQCRYPKEFGGIMVYEATYSEQNLIDNKPFAAVVKSQLTDHECAKPATLTSSTVSSFSTSSSLSVPLTTENTSPPTSTSASMAGMHNSTFTVGPTAPIITGSSPIPSYNSTGIWNGTSSTSVNSGTGSLTSSYLTSTGIWNGTSTAISIVGTGSSSFPPHPTTTGIWNGTSSSSTIIGTGFSSIPPYPKSTGIWNATTSMLPSGTGYTSSSVPVNSSTSTSSQIWMSSEVSSSSRVSNNSSIPTSSYSATTISLHPTGESSGVSSLVSSTGVPYPVDNSSSSAQTPTSSGVVYTTETITITQCPPEVTSCPIRTSVTIHPITSSSSDSITLSSSGPVTSSSNPPDISSSGDSVSMSSRAPFTSTITNSPETTTSSTQTPTLTGVIYTTETVTVTDCSPEVTSCPVRTSVTIYPIVSSSSVPGISSSSAPVTSASANNPEIISFMPSNKGVTTFIVTSYVTTCPITNTITTEGITSLQTTFTVSTVTSTITSVIFSTATPTSMPVIAMLPIPLSGHGASPNPALPPSGSDRSPVGEPASHPAPHFEQPATDNSVPAHSGSSNANSPPSRGKAESLFGDGNTPGLSKGDSSSPYSPPASKSENSPLQPQHAAAGSSPPDASTPPTGNTINSPVSKAIKEPAQGNPAAEGLSTVQNTSTKFLTSTVPASPMESGVDSLSDTASLPVIVTQTLVPIPLSPEQTAQPAVSSSGPEGFTSVQLDIVATSAPFPANNGTATASVPNGASLSASSASGTGAYSPGNVTPFTGSASKTMGSSILALAVVVTAALFT